MQEVTLKFKREKETKNTVRYQEVPEPGRPPIVRTIYVAKWWFNGPADKIEITIKANK